MEEKRKTRRVGTLTAGLLLIIVGFLFFVRLLFPTINYLVIFRFWPCILIFLGVEMLSANFRGEEVIYDSGAIFLVIILAIFSMGMGGVDMVIQHLIEYGCFL
ncbi:MAG: hypothetical protein IKL07_05875 [Clostridium sp.]|nr:hypothetical protein [Clostridium sp.]